MNEVSSRANKACSFSISIGVMTICCPRYTRFALAVFRANVMRIENSNFGSVGSKNRRTLVIKPKNYKLE